MSNETVSTADEEAAANEVADEVLDAASPAAAVALLDPLLAIEKTLVALKAEADLADWDVETTAGDAAARHFRLRCVKIRTAADEAYDVGNKPFLAAQRQARDLVKQIKAFVAPLELAWDAKITAKEKRKALEKLEREQAEKRRVGEIRLRIAAIAGAVLAVATGTAAEVEAKLFEVSSILATVDRFGDFVDEAGGALERARSELRSLHDKALAREDADAELKRQQAELAQQQAELQAQRAAQLHEDAQRVAQATAAHARLLEIEAGMESIRDFGRKAEASKSAAAVVSLLAALSGADVSEECFGEWSADAVELKRVTLESMLLLVDSRQSLEAEASRLEAQRREQYLAELALQIQIDAFEAEKTAAREKIEAEQRQQEVAAQAELDRLAAVAADDARLAAQAALDVAPDAAPEATAIEADQPAAGTPNPALLEVTAWCRPSRPDDAEILHALVAHFGVSPHDALEWICQFDIDQQTNRLREAA